MGLVREYGGFTFASLGARVSAAAGAGRAGGPEDHR